MTPAPLINGHKAAVEGVDARIHTIYYYYYLAAAGGAGKPPGRGRRVSDSVPRLGRGLHHSRSHVPPPLSLYFSQSTTLRPQSTPVWQTVNPPTHADESILFCRLLLHNLGRQIAQYNLVLVPSLTLTGRRIPIKPASLEVTYSVSGDT